MEWKRFQNGLSATIAHCAPRGEKNLRFPLAGESLPLAVLLGSSSWRPSRLHFSPCACSDSQARGLRSLASISGAEPLNNSLPFGILPLACLAMRPRLEAPSEREAISKQSHSGVLNEGELLSALLAERLICALIAEHPWNADGTVPKS